MTTMTTLNEIESFYRRRARQCSNDLALPPLFYAFLSALLFTPFAVASFLFVPFFGQALVLLALGMTGYYLWLQRSVKLLALAVVGCALSFSTLSFISALLLESAAIGAYVLMAFSIAMMLAYLVLVGGAIWQFFEEGAKGSLDG